MRRALQYLKTWRQLRRVSMSSLTSAIRFVVERPGGAAQLVYSMQRSSEISDLLEILQRSPPRVVVEIGTASGGTLFLLSRVASPDAHLVSIDLYRGRFGGGYHPWRIPLYKSFATGNQRITLLRGSSHDPAMLPRLARILGGAPVDFLLIDGDHTYRGVARDFEMYSPLLRPGGLVALHDIMPDPAQPDLEVDRFWRQVKSRLPSRELIESPSQLGYGIGLIRVPEGDPAALSGSSSRISGDGERAAETAQEGFVLPQ